MEWFARRIDGFLNGITMYRLLLYGLSLLALASFVYSATGVLNQSLQGLLVTFGLVMTAGFIVNRGLGRILHIPLNFESGLLTSFILFFILPPADSAAEVICITAAAALALASKFIIAPRRAHIFNPAGFGVGVLALAASLPFLSNLTMATWWVGSSALWPFTLLLGLLVVRKLRRFTMVGTFVLVSLLVAAILAMLRGFGTADTLQLAVTSSPLIFLGTIMLTEPSTSPNRLRQQIIYGTLVGLLYAGQLKLGPVYIFPEIALLLGNIYASVVSRRQHVKLTLQSINVISERVRDYVFTPDRPLHFEPGQYMEWTLPDDLPDGRGNRRTFSLASSPTEPVIHLGVKFYNPASKFKRTLYQLQPGAVLYGGQTGGDFTLPRDPGTKLVFIAGGIGITPFRSMLQFLIDKQQRRDIVVLYSVTAAEELAYREIIERAAALGVRLVPVIAAGPLDETAIRQNVPDFAERAFYVSGPQAMVSSIRQTLRRTGIKGNRIRTDYFSGY